MKIAMGQLLVEGGEPERNLDRAAAMIEEAANGNCDLILLPECLDLAWTHPSCLTEAQPIPGPYSDRLVELARQHGIFICAGLTEQDGDRIYNAAVLIDDAGEILLKHRKINVLGVALHMYDIGDRLQVVDTKFGRIGLNICADNYADSLDIGFVLGRMGAQLILSPSSWTVDFSVTEEDDPYADKWSQPFKTLAEMFDLTIVSATSVGTVLGGPYEGKKMVGCSLAVGPDGPLTSGGYNEFAGEIITIDVELTQSPRRGTEVGAYLRSRGVTAG